MAELPAALRVKRRRDCAAPAEIIIEASSRAGHASAQDGLAASLQQSLAVSAVPSQAPAAAEGQRARKRCRFVLLPGSSCRSREEAAARQVPAAQEQQQGLEGPVLELWHTSGLSAAAWEQSASRQAGAATTATTAPQPPATRGDNAEQQQQHAGDVYADLLLEYLTGQGNQPQQQQPEGRYRRPSARVHQPGGSQQQARASTAAQVQQQQQQQQVQPSMPAYMTKAMLQQHGLWQGQQPQQPADAAEPAEADAADEATEQAMDEDFMYDTYVAVPADTSSSAWPPAHAAGAAGSWQHTHEAAADGVHSAGGAEEAAELPVIQVWEDELLQLQHDWALGLAGGAEEDSDEDSNAEDHYANDYPDEDDGSADYDGDADADSLDSSDIDDDEDEAAGQGRRGVAAAGGGLLGYYQPPAGSSSGGGQRSRARFQQQQHVVAAAARSGDGGVAHDSDDGSFDVDEYVSSSGEQQEQEGDEEFGPAWLRKHCVAYGDGDGGQAWRSVLAQQFGPPQ